jgi:hypothetical protein
MFIVANSSRYGLGLGSGGAAVVVLGGSHTGAEPDAETGHHSIAQPVALKNFFENIFHLSDKVKNRLCISYVRFFIGRKISPIRFLGYSGGSMRGDLEWSVAIVGGADRRVLPA